MNERLIELANKANEDIGYTFKMEEAKQLHELMGKFAELIVRECSNVLIESQLAGTFNDYYDGFNEALDFGATKIKQHFGVE